jgi:hypothetical protein
MTRRRYDDLTRAARRRTVTAALLRSAASSAALLIVYYLAPLDHPLDPVIWIEFVVGLLLFGAVIAWQVRAILGSDVPRLRAIEAVAVVLPLFLLLFASAYVVIAYNVPGSFTEALTRTDALYFTVTVFSTVGFGDIAPVTETARIVTMIQMILDLIAIGLIAKIVLGAVQVAVRRRQQATPGDEQAPGGDGPKTRLPEGRLPEGGGPGGE